jgi:hypothetical protein
LISSPVQLDNAPGRLVVKGVGRYPLLKHISPLSWERINLTGIYTWDREQHFPEGFKSLRVPAGLRRAA